MGKIHKIHRTVEFMRYYLIALQFLTIIPLPFSVRCEKEDLGRATAFFPLVGLSIGAMLAGLNWLIAPWLARPLVDALL
ncbi:MAG: adenosylcobinamide-GDP ribazoletransferase, partial [Pedobacter sp.]